MEHAILKRVFIPHQVLENSRLLQNRGPNFQTHPRCFLWSCCSTSDTLYAPITCLAWTPQDVEGTQRGKAPDCGFRGEWTLGRPPTPLLNTLRGGCRLCKIAYTSHFGVMPRCRVCRTSDLGHHQQYWQAGSSVRVSGTASCSIQTRPQIAIRKRENGYGLPANDLWR